MRCESKLQINMKTFSLKKRVVAKNTTTPLRKKIPFIPFYFNIDGINTNLFITY